MAAVKACSRRLFVWCTTAAAMLTIPAPAVGGHDRVASAPEERVVPGAPAYIRPAHQSPNLLHPASPTSPNPDLHVLHARSPLPPSPSPSSPLRPPHSHQTILEQSFRNVSRRDVGFQRQKLSPLTLGPAMGTWDRKPPPLFLIGAMKSGTTGLHNALMVHEKYHRGKVPPGGMPWMSKELHFFDAHTCKRSFECLRAYESRLPEVDPGHVVIDGTPAYFHLGGMVPRRIQRVYKSIKKRLRFVIILRDPVDRALSHWKFVQVKVHGHNCTGRIPGTRQLDHPADHSKLGCWGSSMATYTSLETLANTVVGAYKVCIKGCGLNSTCTVECGAVHGTKPPGIITRGLYGVSMKQWLQSFDPEQFCIVPYSTFASNSYEQIQTLLNTVSTFVFGDSWVNYDWGTPQRKNSAPSNGTIPSTDSGDLARARAVLDDFFKGGGRRGLYDLLAEKGYLGCGVNPIPSITAPNADMYYGP